MASALSESIAFCPRTFTVRFLCEVECLLELADRVPVFFFVLDVLGLAALLEVVLDFLGAVERGSWRRNA